MASALRSLFLSLTTNPNSPKLSLFPKTDPEVDGEECLHDCSSCSVSYPKNFKIEEKDEIYGGVKAWSTHLLVATGKSDWVRDVEDERGSLMQALGKLGAKAENGVC